MLMAAAGTAMLPREQVAPAASPASRETAVAVRTPVPTPRVLEVESWRVLGSPDAKVTLVEYMDYRCANCAQFMEHTEPELIRRYVDTGQVRLVIKHYARAGTTSQAAAEAAMCAGNQGRFFEFHHALYVNQRLMHFTHDDLLVLARKQGLDVPLYTECMSSGRYQATIRQEMAEAVALRLQGTPAFTINGKALLGAQSLKVFSAMIDTALAAP